MADATDRPPCSCCGRRVAPLDADGRCGYCGINRSSRDHVGDEPCNIGRLPYTPNPADVELVAKTFVTEAKKNPVDTSAYSWGGTSRMLFGPNEFDIARAVLAALAAAGRLLLADAETRIDCEINWTDLRSSRPGAQVFSKSYNWPTDQFDWWLAREIDAEAHHHRVPVDIRRRTVSAFPDGSTLTGPWLPAPADPPCKDPDCARLSPDQTCDACGRYVRLPAPTTKED